MKKLVVMIIAIVLGTVGIASAQTSQTESAAFKKRLDSIFRGCTQLKNFTFRKAATVKTPDVPIIYTTVSDERMEKLTKKYFLNKGITGEMEDYSFTFLSANMYGDATGLKILFR